MLGLELLQQPTEIFVISMQIKVGCYVHRQIVVKLVRVEQMAVLVAGYCKILFLKVVPKFVIGNVNVTLVV